MRHANPTGSLWPSVSLRSALELVLDPVASSEGRRAKSLERQRHSSIYLSSDSFSLFYVVRECLLHFFHRDAVGKRTFAATKTSSTFFRIHPLRDAAVLVVVGELQSRAGRRRADARRYRDHFLTNYLPGMNATALKAMEPSLLAYEGIASP